VHSVVDGLVAELLVLDLVLVLLHLDSCGRLVRPAPLQLEPTAGTWMQY
jgi:hypothetical protein